MRNTGEIFKRHINICRGLESLISGVHAVKMQNVRGAPVNNMNYHAISLLRKEPSLVIIHVCTNDPPYSKGSQSTNDIFHIDIDIIDNRNINNRNLDNKGLHLNSTGTSCFVKNRLSSSKNFWKVKWCPGNINDNNTEPERPSVFNFTIPTSINNS